MEENKKLFALDSFRWCVSVYEQFIYHQVTFQESLSCENSGGFLVMKSAINRLTFFSKYYIIVLQESLSGNLEKVDKFIVTNLCSRAPYMGVFQWSYRMSIKNLLSRLFRETKMRYPNWWKSSTSLFEVIYFVSRYQRTWQMRLCRRQF